MGVAGVLLLTIAGVVGVRQSSNNNFTTFRVNSYNIPQSSNMPRVDFINFDRNELENITPDIFADLLESNKKYFGGSFQRPDLYLLAPDSHLQEGKRPLVPSGFFSNMTKLKIVTLSDCNLTSLPQDVFSGSYSIKSLYLNRNYFKRFKEKIFFDLEDLEVLDLSENNITHLPEKLFYRTKRLKTLKIHNNLLVKIKQMFFLHLSELEYLDLRFNRIQEIKGEPFIGLRVLKSLRVLNISDNQLSSLALTPQLGEYSEYFEYPGESGNYSVLQSCINLEDLQLANNSLTEVYVDWKMALHRLHTLNLAFNNIQTVEITDFNFVRNDVTLDFSNNKIKLVTLQDVPSVTRTHFSRFKFDNNPFVCDCWLLNFVQFVYKMHPEFNENLKCKEPMALENQLLIRVPLTLLTCNLLTFLSLRNCPEKCTCEYRPIDMGNIVNCTRAGLQRVPYFLPKTFFTNHTELILDYNRLTSFSIPRDSGYEDVTHFYLSNNNIKSFSLSEFSKKIKVLDVSHNNLTLLTPVVTAFLENTSDLNLLLLHDNPWLCGCDAILLLKLFRLKPKVVESLQNITCPDNTPLVNLEYTEFCPDSGSIIAKISKFLAILSLLITFFTALYYQYRTQIHIYCFSSKWKVLRWMVSHPDIDVDKKYDAFISYANEDEPFILEHLIPKLEENEETKFKLCLHFRDWKGGDSIPSQILYSVQNSRRTIVVLSPSFLKSVWGIVEFRTAHSEALKTGTSKVIVILKEEVGDITELEDELKAYLQMNTYIKVESPWFWQQLKFALPHPPEDQDDIKCCFGCF